MGKLAVMFPGQGAQFVGMGYDFYQNFDASKRIFDLANEALDFDLKNIVFNGPEEELKLTRITQPAILTTSVAIYEAMKERLEPEAVFGQSLGEYSALVVSGCIDFKTAVWLVSKRGEYMQNEVPEGVGAMAAVLGLSVEDVKEVCRIAKEKGVVEISNINSPEQTVISGEKQAVYFAMEIAKQKGAKRCVELNVSAPFHCSLIKGAGEKLKKHLLEIDIKEPQIPVVSNVTADYMKKEDIVDLLEKQVYTTVNFLGCVNRLLEDGFDTFVEIGPGTTLSGLVKKIKKDVKIVNINKVEDMNNL
ncbi:malonyl CoA-acyl carrier protein transacylase [Caldicellulosiruptor acetigenus I77R1B]|uniref:Malonyl CoA-acyl carrier protein transacylase n=1 Tax=Caldicellulosiruptor acetigenus (strain ATCC 700853 / DSM 12137 / I77R1B) TaxID=632335 RepID=E4S6N1_CALA7|nr:ACP S-malonyltransferase [Caldicellulosiruptor acetigenus]ADQ40646.1 malonyl CoA-acyl carrier protein transacylase [Caldicellulosiruptor acetigenus I77R1B]